MRSAHTSLPSAGALQYLRSLPPRRHSDQAGGRVLFLLRTGLVAVPVSPAQRGRETGWDCEVLAATTPLSPAAPRVWAADVEVETALEVDPGIRLPGGLPPIVREQAWMARIWDRWPGGNMPAVAARMLRHADPDTFVVDLVRPVVFDLLAECHPRLTVDGLIRLLAKLEVEGLIVRTFDADGTSHGRYLVMP